MGDPQYVVCPPTVPPYSPDGITIAKTRYTPAPSSGTPSSATSGDTGLQFIPPPAVEPQRFRRQCLRMCGCHLDIDPHSGSEGEQGLSEAASEEEEPVLARPSKASSPVKNAFPDSFARGSGYHQNRNGRWRG